MTKDKLVNQHILEYEARLKHIKEVYQRAHQAAEHLPDNHRSKSELTDLSAQKVMLEQELEEVKSMSVEDWRKETVNTAGPMAVWDIVAQRLEDFVERHE